jgi:hypothetical protein
MPLKPLCPASPGVPLVFSAGCALLSERVQTTVLTALHWKMSGKLGMHKFSDWSTCLCERSSELLQQTFICGDIIDTTENWAKIAYL